MQSEYFKSTSLVESEWKNSVNFFNTDNQFLTQNESDKLKGRINEYLPAKRVLDVLDLGASATSSNYLPEDLMQGLTAVDIAMRSLKASKGIHKVCADVRDALPFQDERFDLVTMFFVHRYIEDPSDLTREVYRVLRSGGVFIAADFSKLEMFNEVSQFDIRNQEAIIRKPGFDYKGSLLTGFLTNDRNSEFYSRSLQVIKGIKK